MIQTPPANAGEAGLIPESGRSPGRGHPQWLFVYMAKTHFNFLSFVTALKKKKKKTLLFQNNETKLVERS